MQDLVDHFEPHPLFRGGILQTIIGAKFQNNSVLPQHRVHKISLGGKSSLMVLELQAPESDRPLVLLAHGMGGCTESGYMKRVSQKLLSRGFGVFMMNHRGSGVGMGMSERLWNGGSSDDLEKVVQYIIKLNPWRNLLLVGFSLSGNILLKYLGEGRKIPYNVIGAFTVSPPIDLKTASSRLSYMYSGVFNKYYMAMIDSQAEALTQCFPKEIPPPRNVKTIREFDELYTAPASGFQDVDEYYEKCSAGQFLQFIIVPTTILSAVDDPFVPPDCFISSLMSLSVHYRSTNAGGHMGYISKKPTPFGDRRWMDGIIVDWAEKIV